MSAYNFRDLTNQSFEKWTVLHRDTGRLPTRKDSNVYWWCRCQCGIEKSVMGMTLKNGHSTQCRKCWEQGHKHNLNARLWGRILRNAKLRHIPIELGESKSAKTFLYDLLYIQQNSRCALSGLPIAIANTIKGDMNQGETTASLDRINSSGGYTKTNVQWVHKNINRMKLDLDQTEFIGLCQKVAEHFPPSTALERPS